MGSNSGEDALRRETVGMAPQGEKIFVAIRVRPLNEKEIACNDLSDWECVNHNTIVYKNMIPERSPFPSTFTFDRVFGCNISTRQVYEESAKEVALSVLAGFNSSIFAYGQTSSGKTYTMRGITDCAVTDIYQYMERHKEREFSLKFSAMEIYNEAVRDLLSGDGPPLRLLDDPERGTVVEGLVEETLRDWYHLKEILSVCEAQRQIGETSLNETSSRSHQIIRLTVESCPREFLGVENPSTLVATLNFIDLAGSERASQSLSAGSRLKEGCHINRSLLTLGTVVRKLSKGKNGHIPYRDSKLTRILQSSLGGNSRTAIICTMSPARSHVEQSKNTLFFASCAKEVSTSAQVNLVMSDKTLVKHLQKELARLQSELRSLRSGSISVTSDPDALLKEQDILIKKMERQINELTGERDLAQSRVEELLLSVGEDRVSGPSACKVDFGQLSEPQVQNVWVDECSASESSDMSDPNRPDVDRSFNTPQYYGTNSRRKTVKHFPELLEDSEDQLQFDDNSSQMSVCNFSYVGHDRSQSWEDISQRSNDYSEDFCKEVRCVEMEDSSIKKKTAVNDLSTDPDPEALAVNAKAHEISHLQPLNRDYPYGSLNRKSDIPKFDGGCINLYPLEPPSLQPSADILRSRYSQLSKSRSCRAALTKASDQSSAEDNAYTSPDGSARDFQGRPEFSDPSSFDKSGTLSRKDSESSPWNVRVKDVRSKRIADFTGIDDFVAGSNEMTKLELATKAGDLEKGKYTDSEEKGADVGLYATVGFSASPSNWASEFERQQRAIIELWDACHVPLVHRTVFFLLFKGEPSDSVYLEVELRRLSFLKDTLFRGSRTTKDSQTISLDSSLKALNREREALSKQLKKKYSEKERESLFLKFGIGLKTKERKLQLARRLWSNTKDMNHIKESAAIVAKLDGLAELGQAPKEMFGFTFAPSPVNRRSFSWKPSMSSIM